MSSNRTAIRYGSGVRYYGKDKDYIFNACYDHDAQIAKAKHGKMVTADKAIKRALSSECKAVTVNGRRVMRRTNFAAYADARAQRIATTEINGRLKSVMV